MARSRRRSGQRATIAPGGSQRGEQPVGGAVLTEEQQLVLAAEVVIQVAGRQIGGDADVAHARRREAALAEDAGRGAHDLDAAGVRAVLNDGSKSEPRFDFSRIRAHAHGSGRRWPAAGRSSLAVTNRPGASEPDGRCTTRGA